MMIQGSAFDALALVLIGWAWVPAAITAGAGLLGLRSQSKSNRRATASMERGNAEALAFERERMAQERAQWEAEEEFRKAQWGASEEDRLFDRQRLGERREISRRALASLGQILGIDLSGIIGADSSGGGGSADPEIEGLFNEYSGSYEGGVPTTHEASERFQQGFAEFAKPKGYDVRLNPGHDRNRADAYDGLTVIGPDGRLVNVDYITNAGGDPASQRFAWQPDVGGGGLTRRRRRQNTLGSLMPRRSMIPATQASYAPVVDPRTLGGTLGVRR